MTDVREVRRALLAVYDKAGVVETGAGARRDRCRARVLGRDRGHTARGRARGHGRRGGDRLPRDARRTREDAASRGSTEGCSPTRASRSTWTQLAEHGIEPFDLVVVNLYPFRETVASGAGVGRGDREDRHRRARDDPSRREELRIRGCGGGSRRDTRRSSTRSVSSGGLSRATRERLAAAAFAHTAAYDAAVAGWFAERARGRRRCPGSSVSHWRRSATSATGRTRTSAAPSIAMRAAHPPGRSEAPRVLQGKDMSFNNWLDAEAAYALVAALLRRRCVIVKHNNPCGVAVAAIGRGVPTRVRVRLVSRRSAASSRSTRRAPGPPPRRCATSSPRS